MNKWVKEIFFTPSAHYILLIDEGKQEAVSDKADSKERTLPTASGVRKDELLLSAPSVHNLHLCFTWTGICLLSNSYPNFMALPPFVRVS